MARLNYCFEKLSAGLLDMGRGTDSLQDRLLGAMMFNSAAWARSALKVRASARGCSRISSIISDIRRIMNDEL